MRWLHRLGWWDGLQMSSLSVLFGVVFGVTPVLTWIVAPAAPWGLLAVGVPALALGLAGFTAGRLVMKRDPVGDDRDGGT